MSQSTPGQQLAHFASELSFNDIPSSVRRRTEELMLDWLGSTLAGKGGRPVEAICRVMQAMGPANGASELLVHRRTSSSLIAAACNAAASHYVELDDVHNGAVFHPATVVFPAALAVAQSFGRSGAELITAAVAGYEVGIRVSEFLGRSHCGVFHTTGTAGSLAAAAAVGKLLRLSPEQMVHAFGSAGTQAAGLWEFLRDGADSKPLHAAHAASTGLTAAYLAEQGLAGARRILEGEQGMAVGMSTDADESRLVEGLWSRWTVAETSFKVHASSRHTHPAADALLQVMAEHALSAREIDSVTALVHQGALDVLGPVVEPQTVHQSKFSMGTVLGLIAVHGHAGLSEFDMYYQHPDVVSFRDRVFMRLDAEVDDAYPSQWIGKVVVDTVDGRRLSGRVNEPKGDPGNTLSRAELEDKAMRLAAYQNGAIASEMRCVIDGVWNLERTPMLGLLLSREGAMQG